MALYPVGNYGVRFNKQGFDESNGKPFFFLDFTPYVFMNTNTPIQAQWSESKRFYLVGGAVAVTIEQLKALGWPGGDPTTLDPDNPNGFSFVGKEAVLYNKHRNGKPKEDGSIPQYNEWGVPKAGGGGSKYGPSHKSGIASKLAAAFAKAQGGGAAAPTPPPAPAATGEDIPF